MSDLYNVSAAPHVRSPIKTNTIMQDVIIALIPASLFGIFNFGLRALLVILVTVLSCVVTEHAYCRLMKIKSDPWDYSDVVTGLLLALNLPVSIPYWIAILGGVLSFAVFALIFGGHGIDANYLLGQILGGGLILGAFFMATDYVTSPITAKGQIIFGVFLGIMTGIFRTIGTGVEGVSFAIILGNLLVPLIDNFTRPKTFGKERVKDVK